MSGWAVVFSKEVRENLRDRRTMMSTFLLGPLLGPVLFAVLAGFMISMEAERAEKPLELPVVGAQHAPNLVAWLKQHGVQIKPAPAEPEAAIRNRDAEAILRIGPDFGKAWQAGKSAPLELMYDPSRQTALQAITRSQGLLEAYSRQMGALRLLARGVNPEVIAAVQVRQLDLSTPQSRSGLIMSTLPYLLFLTLFMGGMYLAIDTTAGERERQSLEPLLVNPLRRGEIMFGKVCASAAFALASLALSLLLYLVSFRIVPLEQLGMKLALDLPGIALLFLLLCPLAFLAAAVQTALAAFAKSFREAQTYVSLLMLVPALPTLFLAVNPIKPAMWMYAVPFFGQNFLIERIVRGEPLPLLPALVASTCATLAAVLSMWVAGRMYYRESLAVSA